MSYIKSVQIENANGTAISPATDETIILLRRMVKLLESNAVTDVAGRQKVVLDSLSGAAVTTTVPVSGTVVLGAGTAIAGFISVLAMGGVDPRYQFMEQARISYGTAIRANLSWS